MRAFLRDDCSRLLLLNCPGGREEFIDSKLNRGALLLNSLSLSISILNFTTVIQFYGHLRNVTDFSDAVMSKHKQQQYDAISAVPRSIQPFWHSSADVNMGKTAVSLRSKNARMVILITSPQLDGDIDSTFFCLSVNRITQKLGGKFSWNFGDGQWCVQGQHLQGQRLSRPQILVPKVSLRSRTVLDDPSR